MKTKTTSNGTHAKPEPTAPATPAPTAPKQPESHGSLALALLAAQRDIQMLQRDQTNSHQGYDYASADGIVSQCRTVLNRHGLTFRALSPRIEFLGESTEQRAPKGKDPYEVKIGRAVVTVTMRLDHPVTSEAETQDHSIIAESERGRPLDKAILGARTTLIGYAHRDLLNLPRFDGESEVCGRDDSDYTPNQIGLETAQEFFGEMTRLGISIQYIRRKLIEGGAKPEDVSGKLATWPRTLAARLQEGLDRAREAREKQVNAIKALPQREAAAKQDGPTLDRSTAQTPGKADDSFAAEMAAAMDTKR